MAFKSWRRTVSALLWAFGGMTVAGTAGAQTVTINPNTSYQTVRGFGGMNGAGWIADLTSAQIDTAFGTAAGQVGLSIMRMRIDPDSSTWATQLTTAAAAKAKGVTLYYERNGLSLRAARQYTAANIVNASVGLNAPGAYMWTTARTQYDLSAGVNLKQFFGYPYDTSINLSVWNANNAISKSYVQFENAIFDEYKPGRSYTLSARVAF